MKSILLIIWVVVLSQCEERLRKEKLQATVSDLLLGQFFQGNYYTQQQTPLFNYLDSQSGVIDLIFFSEPLKFPSGEVSSVELALFDPIYHDLKAVALYFVLDPINGTMWTKINADVEYSTIWKKRDQDQGVFKNVNYTITILNSNLNSTEAIQVQFLISGQNFKFNANLSYANKTISTMSYCLFVMGMVGIQILSALLLLKSLQNGNPGLLNRISLFTLSLCNIQDFSMTMTHIEYIMSTGSAYLFFILPSVAFIVLFVVFDMKLLFLVWRTHQMRQVQNAQMLRRKLVVFYIQFYVGLFVYLTLSYFFAFDGWLLILTNIFFLPQIVRNARIGTSASLPLTYVLGFLGSRILLPLYQRGCPSNHFLLSPDLPLIIILLGVYALQILFLLLQQKLGARFFVPKMLLPNYYNYSAKLKINQQNADFQCTVCMQSLFAQEPSINSDLLQEVVAMKTPCNHYYHRDCLTQWMEVKLECPTCRAVLPPP